MAENFFVNLDKFIMDSVLPEYCIPVKLSTDIRKTFHVECKGVAYSFFKNKGFDVRQ